MCSARGPRRARALPPPLGQRNLPRSRLLSSRKPKVIKVQGCIVVQNRIFLPQPLPSKIIFFSPKYSEYSPFFSVFSPLPSYHIFSQANQYFIFLPLPLSGGGQMKIYIINPCSLFRHYDECQAFSDTLARSIFNIYIIIYYHFRLCTCLTYPITGYVLS